MSFNKTIRDVADVAAKIMAEKLHPNQQVLDVHEPEKDKLTAQDFKKLRAMKKEEAEVQQEGWDDMMKAVKDRSGPQPSGGSGVKKGRAYGGSAQKDKPEQDVDKPKKKKLSEMVAMYKESGLKSLAEMTKVEQINEEPTSDEFKKEVDKAKAKSEGKDTADVASASVQAVKQESVELEERQMTEPEMKKREEIVKSMKKGLSGFKQRYGERAKSVMYATATKQAMKD